MMREQARYLGDAATVNRATALSADGNYYTTSRIVSPQLYAIRDYDGFLESDAGGTWDIVLKRIPNPVPTSLTVRAVGRNAVDNTLPQVDGTWTVTPVPDDPYRFTLVGSVYGDMDADGGVAFVPGTLIDASPELASLAEWVRAHGGAHVQMPPGGGLYLQSGPLRLMENSVYDCRNCFTFKAATADQTTIFNQSVSTVSGATALSNISDLVVRNLWIYDNRGYQTYYAGQHAINLGTSNAPKKIQQWIEFDGVHVRGSAGYGGSSSTNNGTIHFIKKNGSVKWSDGDSWDRKNYLDRNDQITFENEAHYWPAMGDIGTNLKAVRGIANPFRVATLGTNTVRVTWKNHGWQTGDTVLITGQTVGNGITIPATALTITVVDVNTFTVVGTGSATATTSWGNSDVKILRCIAANSITTYSGQAYFDVPRSTDNLTKIGEKATIAGAGTVNGIDCDGTWDVIEFPLIGTVQQIRLARMDATTGLPTGTTASASGSGGGSTATFNCPHISEGDRIVDSRSARSVVRTLRVTGEFYGRAGLFQRGGEVGDGNGVGANYISISDYRFVDLTPPWVGTKGYGGIGLALQGVGAFARDIHIDAPGGRIGVSIATLATDAQIRDFIIDGPQTGIDLRGDRNNIGPGKIKNTDQFGISIWGYLTGLYQNLGEDPFTPVAIGNSRIIVSATGHSVSTASIATITNITQANPVVITTAAPHGLSAGYKIGVRDVVGMTEINGRAAAYTIVSPTEISLPIDGTGFAAYVSGGLLVNRQVQFSGQVNGSGLVVLGSNRANYTAMYIDANSFYIDAAEEITGTGSAANATTAFGGDSVRAYYGTAAATASDNVIDGVEFSHDDVGNAAVAIAHGTAVGVATGDRGRAADNTIRNCKQTGYATSLVDYDTTGTIGPTGTSSAIYVGNDGIYNQLPIITVGPTDGTTNPTVLTSDDAGKTFCVPATATEQGVFTLPAPTVELIGTEYTFVSLHATLGVKINANGAAIRILAVSAGSSSSVSTTDVGATVTLKLVSVALWAATASVGTWATP